MIDFTCPRCQEALSVPSSLVGKKQKCPACGLATIVPEHPEVDPKAKSGFWGSLTKRLGGKKGEG